MTEKNNHAALTDVLQKMASAKLEDAIGPHHLALCLKQMANEALDLLAAPSASAQQAEQHSMQMAAISTAALGYWKEGDSIHPDYDTVALRDVAKLYAKYDDLLKAAHAAIASGAKQADTCPYCQGEGVDGEPGDEPGTGSTWKCEECNGTGRVQYRTVPVNPTPAMVDAAYDNPERLPAAAKKNMADCIRRAILAAPAPSESPAALTDEQIWEIWDGCSGRISDFARAILNASAVQVRTDGFRDCIDAIRGAIAFGQQDTNPPPEGHWLAEFWQIGRKLAASPADQGGQP